MLHATLTVLLVDAISHASMPAARMAALLAAAFVATAGGDDPPRVMAWTPSGRDGIGSQYLGHIMAVFGAPAFYILLKCKV